MQGKVKLLVKSGHTRILTLSTLALASTIYNAS